MDGLDKGLVMTVILLWSTIYSQSLFILGGLEIG